MEKKQKSGAQKRKERDSREATRHNIISSCTPIYSFFSRATSSSSKDQSEPLTVSTSTYVSQLNENNGSESNVNLPPNPVQSTSVRCSCPCFFVHFACGVVGAQRESTAPPASVSKTRPCTETSFH